jgi:hypothetical protein
VLTLHSSGDSELEVWATSRHLEPFEELVGKPVRIETAAAATPVARAKRAKAGRGTRAAASR